MTIELIDDGTLDTVLRCTECGKEFRFNYSSDEPNAQDYNEFVAECATEIEDEHECGEEND